jgi:xanthine dehydrogenase accessory factor
MATVVDTWGSAPVPIGGQLAISASGEFEGSVSGGCIEGEILTEAEDILAGAKPKTMAFGVADETAWSVGLPCGGQIRVYIERLDAEHGGAELLDRAIAAREGRSGLVVRTRLEDGSRQIFERSTPGMPDDIAQRFSTAKSQLVTAPEGEVFLHALIPPARIIAIGATHITQLLGQIAQVAGYEMVVVDPRTAFATPERFPGVQVVAEWPQDALPKLGLDPYSALAVLAHVSHIDDEALKVALKSDVLYIGALGSKRNHDKRRERLIAAGFTPADLARIKAPIGLEIGAQTPAEIALSVMCEIVLAVRGPKRGKSAAQPGAGGSDSRLGQSAYTAARN